MKHLNRIGIAGCGIGGLALGALLAARGVSVRIYDQFDAPAPVGSGLVVQPVGLRVLQALGGLEPALNKGAKINQMLGQESGGGKIALDVSYGARFGLAIHRASLFEVLLKIALKNGCEVISSTKITGRKDGYFLGEDNTKIGPFDLLVDASGANSRLSPLQSTPLQYGAVWASVDWPANTALPQNQLTQCYHKASKMAGVLPIGTLPGETTRKAAIFWSLRRADFAAWQQKPIADWKAEAHTLWPEFAPFAAQITQHSDLTMAKYKHGSLRRKFGEGIAYIGDAAHCASPQLGQGANMALLDAYALSTALLAHPAPDALRAYNRARSRHVLAYQMMSRLLTPLYQSDSAILPWVRNHILAPLSPRAPFRQILTKVGAGDVISPVRGLVWPPQLP